LKLSLYAHITILLAIILGASILATAYYYYVIPPPSQLRVLYTHSSEMVEEIVNGFKTWYQQKYGRSIQVTITKTSFQTASEKAKAYAMDPGADIWWGGPLPFFQNAAAGLLPYNSTYKNEINATCRFSPEMDSSSTPYWYAASQYGLGVMYNEHVLGTLNLSKPKTWADLLDQNYVENVTMTEPTNSEFMSLFIMLILQSKMQTTNEAQDWTAGWEYLIKLAASIKEYDNSEGDTALKVSSGYLPLAIVPDFFAYDKMAIPVPDINFTYLDATLLQPDPIAIFNKGKYLKEAKAFIDFILTQQAQSIIGKYLLPIRSDATAVPPRINPFDSNFPFIASYNKTFEEKMRQIVEDYYSTWITQKHSQVRALWREITEVGEIRGDNPLANHYYELSESNFTYLGRYLNRTYTDAIYSLTGNWTDSVRKQEYMTQWSASSENAYAYASVNIQFSKGAIGYPTPFVGLYPYSLNMSPLNYTRFLEDLDSTVELGFRGVKLWNVECFYDEGLLEQVMDDLAARNLSVIIPFRFFDRTYKFNASQIPAMPSQAYDISGFPDNTTQREAFINFVNNVTKIVKSKQNLLFYSIYYPFDATNEAIKLQWIQKIQNWTYSQALQYIIDAINDTAHPISLVAENWDENPFLIYDKLPYNLTGFSTFGIQPYSITLDNINGSKIIQFYNYFMAKGKTVYIDEWGFHTNAALSYGLASNEANKSRLIKEFVDFTRNWKIVWCYFGLHDDVPSGIDFGLVDADYQLKESGEAMKEALQQC